jgi:hypothetical protein
MNACTTPVVRKRLVDPAACGVRLGVELRAAAEREAYQAGMCLSHWIKRLVQDAIASGGREADRNTNEFNPSLEPKSDSFRCILVTYRRAFPRLGLEGAVSIQHYPDRGRPLYPNAHR